MSSPNSNQCSRNKQIVIDGSTLTAHLLLEFLGQAHPDMEDMSEGTTAASLLLEILSLCLRTSKTILTWLVHCDQW